ncbi:MAG: M48 family metalloprotease [Alphaproteobacteria bacterium]|nr:M48 family metalloprotease [Alphaproteobacteria bacterium]
MTVKLTKLSQISKQTIKASLVASVLMVGACSTNPATGDRQFTALMPTSSEAQVGAQEHAKVQATYGNFMTGPIADYVNRVGQKVAANTERKDIQYKFYVIDSPMVNAFALPGGYIYISRGLMTLANSEAELAAVIGHEIGHVTARHAAERMSHGTLVGLGAAVLGAATGSSGVAQAANLGSNLYISSYSRGQENQSDELGVRYVSRAGYNPLAMSEFLRSLDAQSKLEAKEAGKNGTGFSYFSSHPLTAERVQHARAEAAKYSANNTENRAAYLSIINGMTFGDSADQGFARGNSFYHTSLGFAFTVPNGSKITNGTTQVAINHSNGTVILFDTAKANAPDPLTYLNQTWLRNENTSNSEAITINGFRAATGSFSGNVQGRAVTVRLVAIEWKPGEFYRFSMAIPKNVSGAFVDELKKTTYSFRRLSDTEKRSIQPKKLYVLQAPASATVASMAAKMDVDGNKTENFLVLNGMSANAQVIAGQPYKIVVD